MEFIFYAIVLLIAGLIGSKCHASLHKDIVKKALEEYEKEKSNEKGRE